MTFVEHCLELNGPTSSPHIQIAISGKDIFKVSQRFLIALS